MCNHCRGCTAPHGPNSHHHSGSDFSQHISNAYSSGSALQDSVACPSVCLTEYMRVTCEPCATEGDCPSECYQCAGCWVPYSHDSGHGSNTESYTSGVPADGHQGNLAHIGCPSVCLTEQMRISCEPCSTGGFCASECHQCAGCGTDNDD
jgi:hypothetical protein